MVTFKFYSIFVMPFEMSFDRSLNKLMPNETRLKDFMPNALMRKCAKSFACVFYYWRRADYYGLWYRVIN